MGEVSKTVSSSEMVLNTGIISVQGVAYLVFGTLWPKFQNWARRHWSMIELDCQCDLVTPKLMQMSAVGMLRCSITPTIQRQLRAVCDAAPLRCAAIGIAQVRSSRHLRLWAGRL
jgi:hypothetical protein